jgi:hypothetical protein
VTYQLSGTVQKTLGDASGIFSAFTATPGLPFTTTVTMDLTTPAFDPTCTSAVDNCYDSNGGVESATNDGPRPVRAGPPIRDW